MNTGFSGTIDGEAQVLLTPTPPLTNRPVITRRRLMPTIVIPLSQGKVALIDAEDAERVLEHNWYATRYRHTFYARTRIGKTKVYLHRFIMQPASSEVIVDHIDGDGLICTRSNLRCVTRSQNMQNRINAKVNGSSGYIGVCWDKIYQCWVADVSKDGESVRVGRYATAQEAALARDQVALRLFGEFAGLNFPDLFAVQDGRRR